MRLYNIFYLCKNCLPSIKEVQLKEIQNSANVMLIKNWGNCKKSLDALKRLECFDKKVTELYKLLDWKVKMDEIRLPVQDKVRFENIMAEISYAVETLVNLCNDMEMGKTSSGIHFKIPKCSSLKE